ETRRRKPPPGLHRNRGLLSLHDPPRPPLRPPPQTHHATRRRLRRLRRKRHHRHQRRHRSRRRRLLLRHRRHPRFGHTLPLHLPPHRARPPPQRSRLRCLGRPRRGQHRRSHRRRRALLRFRRQTSRPRQNHAQRPNRF